MPDKSCGDGEDTWPLIVSIDWRTRSWNLFAVATRVTMARLPLFWRTFSDWAKLFYAWIVNACCVCRDLRRTSFWSKFEFRVAVMGDCYGWPIDRTPDWVLAKTWFEIRTYGGLPWEDDRSFCCFTLTKLSFGTAAEGWELACSRVLSIGCSVKVWN